MRCCGCVFIVEIYRRLSVRCFWSIPQSLTLLFASAFINVLEKNATGRSSPFANLCDKTAPMPRSDASVSRIIGSLLLKWARVISRATSFLIYLERLLAIGLPFELCILAKQTIQRAHFVR